MNDIVYGPARDHGQYLDIGHQKRTRSAQLGLCILSPDLSVSPIALPVTIASVLRKWIAITYLSPLISALIHKVVWIKEESLSKR